MKLSNSFQAFTFLVVFVSNAASWDLIKRKHLPDSKPGLSIESELLSVVTLMLEEFLEDIKKWEKLQPTCDDLERQLDEVMNKYKASRDKKDAATTLAIIDLILFGGGPCLKARDSAVKNALSIARDFAGVPNVDKTNERSKVFDEDSKASELGRKTGRLLARLINE